MKNTDPRKKVLEYQLDRIDKELKIWNKNASDEIEPDKKKQWILGIERLQKARKETEDKLKDP